MTTAPEVGATTLTTPSDREIVITRVFDAPRRLVFEVWTRPEHLPHWMTGRGDWAMTVCEIDLRPGGSYRLGWSGPGGAEMEITGVYEEVAPPGRLVFVEAWGGDWPQTHNTLLLTEEDGLTTMSVTVLYPSQQARDAALETGMKDGMSAGFERLENYVRTMA